MTQGRPDIIRYATATFLRVMMCWGCLTMLSVPLVRQLRILGGGGFDGLEGFWVKGGRGSPEVGWAD